MTDSQGRTVSFKNTILIMTSNLGSQAILEGMSAGHREAVKDTVMSMVCAWTNHLCAHQTSLGALQALLSGSQVKHGAANLLNIISIWSIVF